ncbi:hypothetical protein [Polyangium mundeleinium]|uniref:Tetratricopeptide repeat protein n=1 Tax=Polyangium mundeleinium TaxID=2995306 RepID=A0ABT5ELG6_9BACT|nr:hypothetical protein [Polyangium mundeleinium]MDC0742663.1 hypothetical protein [Polyangium mundeleinium]
MRWSFLLLVAALAALPACWGGVTGAQGPAVNAALRTAVATKDALVIADTLEDLIAAGVDTPEDRQLAYAEVRAHAVDTAAYTYARAVVTGRLVQLKGLLGADMVGEVEHYARRSRELDPSFRDGAATRMLGTLYVVAPAALLRNGDSETGLELLEGLVQKAPDVIENHLRVAEAYIALGDVDPAKPHLCRCSADRGKLRRDDQALLAQLLKDAGNPTCPKPAATAPTP